MEVYSLVFFSIDWMRALSYKHANVRPMTVTLQTLKMGVLERGADRKWINLLCISVPSRSDLEMYTSINLLSIETPDTSNEDR